MFGTKQLLFWFFAVFFSLEVRGEWRWTGKVAVVTGASSGIGAELAVTLANRGVIVAGLARREERLKELLHLTNGTIYPVRCDLSNEEDILNAFRKVEQTLGGVDILINNAGIHRPSSLLTGKSQDWASVLNLNVVSLSIATREALKTMRTRGDDGHIINMNSLLGHEIPKYKGFTNGMYPASKFALTALTQSVSFELSNLNSKIKVTSLSPGLVNTELSMNSTTSQTGAKSPITFVPFIEPSDVAEAVIFILSTRPNVQIAELTINAIGSTFCG